MQTDRQGAFNPQVVNHVSTYDELKVGDLAVINIDDEFEDPSGQPFVCTVLNKAKKKILCLKACENFSNRRGMRFFIFYFIFFYFNWHLPPRTSEIKSD